MVAVERSQNPSQAALLGGLSAPELGELVGQAAARSYRRQEMIFRAGEAADRIFVLQRGLVRLYRLTDEGQELTLAILRPGDVCGVAALVGNSVYPRFAQALMLSGCICLQAEALLRLFGPKLELALRLTGQVGRLLDRTEDLATELAFQTVRQRLAQTLLRLYAEQGAKAGSPAPKLTHGDLAALIGTTREHVTRLLQYFEDAGYVFKVHGHLAAIRDAAGLCEEAAGPREARLDFAAG